MFNQLFFPSFDPLSGTMLAFSTFAVGYFSRPVGGVIFGHLGDRYGRRFVLVTTLHHDGHHHRADRPAADLRDSGRAEPVLLVALRFVQGVALGGEWAGAVLLSVEHGDQRQRGRNASWAQMGPSIGTLLATGSIALVTVAASRGELSRLGLAPAVLRECRCWSAFGLWIRIGVQETPLFRQLEREQAQARAPLGEVVRDHWRKLLLGGGARIGPDVLYSLAAVFSLTYLTTMLGLSRTLALTALSIGGACNALTIPIFGVALRPYGRRVVYGIGVVCALGARRSRSSRCSTPDRRSPSRSRSSCRADRARHDVRAAGGVHRRAVSDAGALCRRVAGVHVGRHRRRRHRAFDVRHVAEDVRHDARAQRVSCSRIAHHRHRAASLHASAPASRSTSNSGSHP